MFSTYISIHNTTLNKLIDNLNCLFVSLNQFKNVRRSSLTKQQNNTDMSLAGNFTASAEQKNSEHISLNLTN